MQTETVDRAPSVPCTHDRLTWGCDPCRHRVAADQRLAEVFDDDSDADEFGLLDGIDRLLFAAEGGDRTAELLCGDVPYWPTITVVDVMLALRPHPIVVPDLRAAVVTEAWSRRCRGESVRKADLR